MPRPKNVKRKQQLMSARAALLDTKRQNDSDDEWDESVKKKKPLSDSEDDDTNTCASKLKINRLISVAGPEQQQKPTGQDQFLTLSHTLQLTRLISDLLCPECFADGMKITVCEMENQGFASKLNLQCNCGQYIKSVSSSPRIDDSEKENVAFEINSRMVLFSHEKGKSHAALDTFASVIGIPNMHLTTYQSHDKRLTGIEVDAGEELLQRTARIVRQAYAEADPDIQDAIDSGEVPVIDIAVSFDGTWQKRGFTSLYGVGVCIDVLTGLVVDFHVLSKYCHACKLKEKQLPADQFAQWKAQHQADCCINHTASSKAMEQEAAKAMWQRSEEKLKFRFVDMLSHGDSAAYKAVYDLRPYGDTEVSKLECVNHAHKRIGTALRKLTKEQRLGGRGVGRLTAGKCDSLQNFYRGVRLFQRHYSHVILDRLAPFPTNP